MYVGGGAVDKRCQAVHAPSQVHDTLCAPDIDGDGGAEGIVKLDRCGHVKDDADLFPQLPPILL